MNIKTELLKDRYKLQISEVAKYIKLNNSELPMLVNLLKSDDELLRYRASWCISACYDLKVPNLNLYCKTFTEVLLADTLSPVKRNVLRVLQWIDIPEEYHGNLINSCFGFIDDMKEPIAVKAFSFGVLEKMCGFYPDLKSELLLVCDNYKNSKSAGIRSRVNRVYKFLA